jgi:sulfite exporter TauE/SafE
MDELNYLSAFLVGLLGGVHCVGMCGGIVSAMTLGIGGNAQRSLARIFPFHIAYNLGRIVSYTVAGGLMGGLGIMLASFMPVYLAQQLLLAVAGVFMILLGLYLGGWLMWLSRLEQAGSVLWKRLEPLGRKLLPVRHVRQALLLGLLWGWLPCGLVYSVLIWSVSAGSVQQGSLLMLSFGLGTLPNLLAMGIVAGKLVQFMRLPRVRKLAGFAVLMLGVYNLWLVI